MRGKPRNEHTHLTKGVPIKSGRGRGERKPRGEEQREGKKGRGEGRSGKGGERGNGFVEKDYLGGEREIDLSPLKLDDNAKINA